MRTHVQSQHEARAMSAPLNDESQTGSGANKRVLVTVLPSAQPPAHNTRVQAAVSSIFVRLYHVY